MSNQDLFEQVLNEYRNATNKQCINIKVIEDSNPNLTESKFGGLPYLPHDTSCPMTVSGEQLHFLAQYRLEELPPNNIGLPSAGMLQFWVLMDEVLGVENENYILNNKHRVIYYKTVDQSVTRESVEKKYCPPEDEYRHPVANELAISFERDDSIMDFEDRYFDEVTHQIEDFRELNGDERDEFYQAIMREGHFIGGHPVHPQHDIRDTRYSETFNKQKIDYSNHDILLLQMDSEVSEAGKDLILWGDMGNAHFFITEDDLKHRDFSNVLYEWSCY